MEQNIDMYDVNTKKTQPKKEFTKTPDTRIFLKYVVCISFALIICTMVIGFSILYVFEMKKYNLKQKNQLNKKTENREKENITAFLTKRGLLYVYKNGERGTVCDDKFDDKDARVVCRMIGKPTPFVTLLAKTKNRGTGLIALDNVECRGDEQSLIDCRWNKWGRHDCSHAEDVSMQCDRITAFIDNNGLLRVTKNGETGTVCDDGFGPEHARVVCRMLRLPFKTAHVLKNVKGGSGFIALDEVKCHGNESSLNECTLKGWGEHNCNHAEDVGILCRDDPITVSVEDSGLLYVSQNGERGAVCHHDFDERDARVVCRMLGRPSYRAYVLRNVNGTETGVLSHIDCIGDEASLNQCKRSKWKENSCIDGYVGVLCEDNIITVSLDENGLLYATRNGSTGTVCDDSFQQQNAQVVCRMLGKPYKGAEVLGGVPGTGLIALDDVECSGDEVSLNECRLNPWTQHNCEHMEDVRIICGENSTYSEEVTDLITVHLEDNGLLRVTKNGELGTVCEDAFGEMDARIICRMLGKPWIRPTILHNLTGSGMIALDEVNCLGNEVTLSDCRLNSWGKHDCSHDEDVGVICEEDNRISVSLGADHLLYVTKNGQTGTVCNHAFDLNCAIVVCRMLNRLSSSPPRIIKSVNGTRNGLIALDGVHCSGEEATLNECRVYTWGEHNCGHNEDVGVQC